MINAADAAVTQLEQVVARGNFAAIPGAYDQAHTVVLTAASAVQTYHEALCDGGENCVKGLKGIKEASKLILNVTAEFVTFGKPQFKAPMAAALGSYEELLDQIEAAQTSKSFDVRRAAVIVLAAGAREGFLAQLMNDGQVKRLFANKYSAKFAKTLGMHCGTSGAAKIIDKMFRSAIEEGVKAALGDVIKQSTGGKKLTFEQAAHQALEKAIEAAGISAILGKYDKLLDGINDNVLRGIASGAIKGLKVASPKAARELKVLVEETAGAVAGKFLDQFADDPAKLRTMDDAVVKKVLSDPAFKAAALKLIGQKTK